MAVSPASRVSWAAAAEPSATTDMERARELYENGRRLYDEGSYDGAILAFQRAYELSGDANLLYNISAAYDRLGDFEQAILYLDRYRALAPAGEREALQRKRRSLQVRLEKQREAETVQPAEPEPEPEVAPITAPAPEPRPPRIYDAAAASLTAVAIAGFGAGLGFGVASLLNTRRAESSCNDGLCADAVRRDVEAARWQAIAADVGFAVGGVATISLVTLLAVRAHRRRNASTTALRPAPGGFRF